MESNTGEIINGRNLYHRFEGLQDKRTSKGKRCALATIVAAMFLAKLCGEEKSSGIAGWVALRGTWMAQSVCAISSPFNIWLSLGKQSSIKKQQLPFKTVAAHCVGPPTPKTDSEQRPDQPD